LGVGVIMWCFMCNPMFVTGTSAGYIAHALREADFSKQSIGFEFSTEESRF
jgi:hypothetical protein